MIPRRGRILRRVPRKVVAPDLGASSSDRILQAAKKLFATQGYENTTTLAIARLAGTSESQLMKHFRSKEGLLEAIFLEAWHSINTSLRRRIEDLALPAEKLRVLVTLTLGALKKDPDLKILMLLEGRRIRKAGQRVLLDERFQEFVQIVDGVLREMREAGQLRADLRLECIRSALMGAMEGLLRDRLLAELVGFPARYREQDLRRTFDALLESVAPSGPGGLPAPT